MIVRYLICFLALITFNVAQAQHEGDYWYFGSNAGIHFENDGPEALLDGALNTTEGCASISTPDTGELLFYTDGSKVYNRNHEIMVNGTGLNGNISTTQSAVIVPKPESNSKYYVFTLAFIGDPDGLQYSVVDMALDNGLGAVTTKNTALQPSLSEKLTAIKNINSNSYWVVAHAKENNTFYAYKVTSTGINTIPVTSTSGPVLTGPVDNYGLGYMKFSPDGTKLALANPLQHFLFNFNSDTGVVSNAVTLNSYSFDNTPITYGTEFSPNSKVVYFDTDANVFQYDLEAGTTQDIIDSQFELPLADGRAMQLGPDGKIYIATNPGLAVINSPNTVGTNCNLELNAVNLQGRSSEGGLPNFVQSFFEPNTFIFENTCFGETTSFSLVNDLNDVESVNWNFDDPDSGADNTSTLENPTHNFTAPGIYTVSIEITVNGNTSSYETTIKIYEQPVANPVEDILACDDNNDGFYNFDLTAQENAILNNQDPEDFHVSYYNSQEDFANNDTIEDPENFQNTDTFQSQMIYAKVKNETNTSCQDSTSFSIKIFRISEINPNPPKLSSCGEGKTAVFDLTEIQDSLLNNQNPADFSFHFYTNAERTDEITAPESFENLTFPQTIYVRVENKDYDQCSAETSFDLEIFETPETPSDLSLESCGLGNDTAEFNLLSVKNQLLDEPDNFTITFINENGDSLQAENPFTSSSQNLTAVAENPKNTECFSETIVHLEVVPKPKLTLPDSVFICGENAITLTADPGFDHYEWSTGETSRKIEITEKGTYELRVSNESGELSCKASTEIVVEKSGKAKIRSIDVKDWSARDNQISVNSSGIGNYEFSIDGISYQDSPVFSNLDYAKNYTVFVRDKNGCGVVSKEVNLLYYPKFLTPNQDGINDKWQIFNAYQEPEMKIYIFDRFGKLLTRVNPGGSGWDGTYQGKPMPSNDYWFLVKRKNGENHSGHFTLKR